MSTNVLGFGENDYHSNTNLSLSYTYTITATLVNQLSVGYMRSLVDQVPVQPFSASSLGITAPTQVDGTPSINVTGLFSIGTNRNNSQSIRQSQVQISDTISQVIGRHQLRFGGDVDPSRFAYSDLFAQEGEIDIQSFPDFLLGMSGAQNGSPYSNLTETLAGNGRPESYPASNNFSLFAQDDFRVNTRSPSISAYATNLMVSLIIRTAKCQIGIFASSPRMVHRPAVHSRGSCLQGTFRRT